MASTQGGKVMENHRRVRVTKRKTRITTGPELTLSSNVQNKVLSKTRWTETPPLRFYYYFNTTFKL